MIKNIIICSLLIVFQSCSNSQGSEYNIRPYISNVTVDGCEYVILSEYFDGSGSSSITHKGNCTNHIK